MEYKILEKMFAGEKPESVFEVGCANGGLLKDLGVKIVGGIDRHPGDIDKSKTLFSHCAENFILQDITSFPWPINKLYDVVFSVGTLMYIKKPVRVIEEMMKFGSKVILAEPVEGEISRDKHGERYYHDYEGMLKSFRVEILGEIGGKKIFKCNLN